MDRMQGLDFDMFINSHLHCCIFHARMANEYLYPITALSIGDNRFTNLDILSHDFHCKT